MQVRRLTRLGIFVLGWAGAVGAAEPRADAPDAQQKKADALFKEGRERIARGEIEAGCAKFEESLALSPGVGTQFNLADCKAKLGENMAAHRLFTEVARVTHERGETKREQTALARAKELEASVVLVTIEVDASDAKIERNGEVVPAGEVGTAFAVTPGVHTFAASAPGKKSWSKRLETAAGEAVLVRVPRLEAAAEAPRVAATKAAPARKTAAVAKPKPGKSKKKAPAARPVAKGVPERKVASQASSARGAEGANDGALLDAPSWLLIGAAGAGTLVGVTSLILYQVRNEEAETICPASNNCSQSEIAAHSRLVDQAKVARIGVYLGFGLTGFSLAGLGLTALRNSEAREKAQLSGALQVGPGMASAAVSGQW